MVFKTYYQKLRRIYTEMQPMVTKYTDDALKLADAFTGGDASILNGAVFSTIDYTINCAVQSVSEELKVLQLNNELGKLKEIELRGPMFTVDEEALGQVIDGVGTLEDVLHDACTKAASVQTMAEATRLVLLGEYSPEKLMSKMRAKTGDNLALTYASLDDIMDGIPSSASLGSASAMITWIDRNFSFLNTTKASTTENKVQWTEMDYSFNYIAGFGWLDVLSSAATAVGVLLSFTHPVIGILLAAVGAVTGFITNIVNQNVNNATMVNYGTGMPSWNLRIGRLSYIPEFLESAVAESGCATYVGQYVCMYSWIDDDGNKFTEVYPSAYGQVGSHPGFTNNDAFKFTLTTEETSSTHVTRNQLMVWKPNGNQFTFNDIAPFFNGPVLQDVDNASDTDFRWMISNCLFRWALTYAAGLDTYVSWASGQDLEHLTSNTEIGAVAGMLLYKSLNLGSWTSGNTGTYIHNANTPLTWGQIKSVCEYLDSKGGEPWLYPLFMNNDENDAIDPYIIDRGNFLLMAPNYSSMTVVNTILAFGACALGAMAIAYGAHRAYKVIKRRSIQKRLEADTAKLAAMQSGSAKDIDAYLKADKRATKYENMVQSIGAPGRNASRSDTTVEQIEQKLSAILALIK